MKFQRFMILAVLFSILTCFVPFESVQATSVVSLSDAQLVKFSDYIIHATIVSAEPFQYDDHTIVTRVTVQVHEYLKAPGDSVQTEQFEFYTRGGILGDVRQTVPGEYEPVVGTEGVFFLEKIKRFHGLPLILGLTQGVFSVENLPVTRSDRRSAKVFQRKSEFVRNPSDFDRAVDFYELRDAIMHTVKSETGAENHE